MRTETSKLATVHNQGCRTPLSGKVLLYVAVVNININIINPAQSNHSLKGERRKEKKKEELRLGE